MCCIAKPESSGKPITTPATTMVRLARSSRFGSRDRSPSIRAAARLPAIAARAEVRKTGSNPLTPRRVAGVEPLNTITASSPFSQPLVLSFMITSSLLYRLQWGRDSRDS